MQKRFRIPTKTVRGRCGVQYARVLKEGWASQMLCFNVFWILVLTIWGLVGIHTDRFGFKHVWEIWYENFPLPLVASSDDLNCGVALTLEHGLRWGWTSIDFFHPFLVRCRVPSSNSVDDFAWDDLDV